MKFKEKWMNGQKITKLPIATMGTCGYKAVQDFRKKPIEDKRPAAMVCRRN